MISTKSKALTDSGGRKKLVACHKCNKNVDIKNTILCCICKRSFEFNCIGFPQKVFQLMSTESRKKWTCGACTTQQTIDNPSHNSRRRNKDLLQDKSHKAHLTSKIVQRSKVLEDSHVLTDGDTSDDPLSTPMKLSRSLDDTVNDHNLIQELKETITQLESDLASTQNEFENTIIENNGLHRQINILKIEINSLKAICKSPQTRDQVSSSAKKIRKSNHGVKINATSTPTTSSLNSRDMKQPEHDTNDLIIKLQLRITELETDLLKANKEISALSKEIDTWNYKLKKRSSSPVTKAILTTGRSSASPKNKLWIYGTQTCVGVASALMNSRSETKYGIYDVQAETKPFAQSKDILKNILESDVKDNDKLIICVGENDHDLKGLMSQLNKLFLRFSKNTIIFLNIFKNNFIYAYHLNNSIRKMCNKHKHCRFVECEQYTLIDICKSINYVIDCEDYDHKYLNFKETRQMIARNKQNHVLSNERHTKGTIPYYFHSIKTNYNTGTGYTNEPKIEITNNAKVGTIPFYFQKLRQKDKTFFRR